VVLARGYYVSDSHFNGVSEAQVLSAEAYLLFYEAAAT